MDQDNINEAPLSSIDADRLAATRSDRETRPISGYGSTVPVAPPVAETVEYGDALRRRPTGVTVISVLNFVSAALTTVIFVLALGADVELGVWGFVVPLQIIFAIVVGVGLLQLKNWARILAFIGYSFNIAYNIIALLTGPVEGSTLIGIAIAGIIIWYLRQPKVAEAFG